MEEGYKRKLQLKIMETIREIDKICKDNNIKYSLAYGSVLGAVRHGGFIPWDDDFDIMLKYEDYLKFIKVCQEKLDKEKYFVQTLETDSNYYLSFAKIRNIQTTLIEENNKNEKMVNGVYIDVFPLVGYPNKNKIKKMVFQINRAFVLSANRNIINNKVLYSIFKIVLKIFGKEKIINYGTKQCVKYKCEECDQIISVFDGDGIRIGLTSNKVLGGLKRIKFEDMLLPVPEDTDTYLKNLYGDYMKIPSKEEIEFKTHTPYILDLDHSYEEYKKINKSKEKICVK